MRIWNAKFEIRIEDSLHDSSWFLNKSNLCSREFNASDFWSDVEETQIACESREEEIRNEQSFNYKLTEYGETETGARARRSVGGRHVVLLFLLCVLSLSLFFSISHSYVWKLFPIPLQM